MAKENNDIGDIVKKCKILLLDIEGTTTSISFVKDKLYPYAQENVKGFLENQWEQEDVKKNVTALRKLALEDKAKSAEGVVTIPGEDASKEAQIEGLVNNMKWQMSSDRKTGPLKLLQGLIWKQGYDKGDIKGHIYDDVLPALEQWRTGEGQKIYIYSSGSVQAQKLLFSLSSAGDLLPLIDGHFDTGVGPKQEVTSYTTIAEKIGCKSDDILFLTDIVKEAEAARSSGMHVGLVSREGNTPLPADATATFPVLHSFVQLTATNKRKPDTQDEQPAKVLKTDIDDNVKTVEDSPKPKIEESETTVTVTEESEKMEVDEEDVDAKEFNKKAAEEPSANAETVTDNITVVNETIDASGVGGNELVSEVDIKKNEKNKTEGMEMALSVTTEMIEKSDKKMMEHSNKEKDSVGEETPSSIVTEIEEISDETQSLSEMAEIIEDLNPVIEEPENVEDMEDLKNVGEVLEKECDEILSKVQDVTNLDNIPIKPLLNTIAEETMETENLDSNDIVERILDTEMEMQSKPCLDTDITNVRKVIAEDKENNMDKDQPEKDVTENVIIDSCKKDQNPEGSSPKQDQNPERSSLNQTTVDKSPADKKEAKMETVECQTETKMETVGSQVNMDENKIEMQESKDEAKERKMVTDKEVLSKEIETDKDSNLEKETKVSTGQEESKLEIEDKEKIGENKIKKGETEEDAKVNVEDSTVKSETFKVTNKDSTSVENSTETEVVESKAANSEEVKPDNVLKDTLINGNTTNGESDAIDFNGDGSKNELSSRLSVENGKEVVNGSNGNSTKEHGQGDNKIESDVTDLKVKTVTADESPSEPIEQPTEA